MIDPPDDDPAPLFRLFWDNGSITPARELRLGEAIGIDAVQAGAPPRPRYNAGPWLLPPPASEVTALWRQRHSQRVFGPAGLTVQQVAELLAPLASHAPHGDAPARRLLPSGGAKYPVLTYAAVLRMPHAPALEGRLAWYDPDAHALVPLDPLPDWTALATHLGVDWPDPPALVLMFVLEGAGSLAKYGERGGRFLLIETGIALAAVQLEATRLGLATVPVASYRDAALQALTGLPPPTHAVALALAVGAPGG